MAKLKRLASAVVSMALAAVMLTGCDNGRYCMSYKGNDVNSGVYIYNILSEMLNQQYMMYYTGESSTNVMDKEVDGKEMAAYLEDTAMKNTKEYCALCAKFDELGLSLSDDETKSINSSATDTYNAQKDMLEEMGISKESIKMVLKQSKMKTKIFEYYYGKDGKKAVSDDEIEKYVNENYLRYKTISISKSSNSDATQKDKENKENEELIDKYFSQAQGKSFEDFDKVIDEYNKYVEEKNKQTSSSSDDSSKVGEPDSSSQTDSSSKTDSSSQADSSSKTDSSSQSDTSSKAGDDTSSSSDNSSSTKTTGDTDKYKNESMTNYSNISEESLKEDYGKLMTEIKNLKNGEIKKYSNDQAYYILIKGDVTQRSKEYASENRDTIIKEMKDKEFDEMIKQWEDEIDIKVDNNAIKRYSAKSLYKRYTDYLTKGSKTNNTNSTNSTNNK